MKLLDLILRLLFPPQCVLCKKLLESEETGLCHHCRQEAPQCPISGNQLSFLAGWVALWYYEDDVRSSILRFKFQGKRGYGKVYGQMLALKLLQEYPEGFDLLTWVPIGRFRRLIRGYDQGALLASAVGAELGIPPTPLLEKIRRNKPQSRIRGQAQRRANVLGVYKTTNPEILSGKRILLLDDVITTGSTAGECARVLLTAGAKEVYCGAVARTRHAKR